MYIKQGDLVDIERMEDSVSLLKVAVGVSLHWKVGNYVNINVRLVFAYGVGTDEFKVPLGTNHIF